MSVEVGTVGVFGTCRGGTEPSHHCSIEGAVIPHSPKESFPAYVCFHTGVVLQVQWTQKNGQTIPFLLRLSFSDGLQD